MFSTFAPKFLYMEFTAQQIADFIQGKVDGNASVKVSSFSKIEDGQPGTLSFLSNPKYSQYIYDSNASVILVNNTFIPEREVKATLIRVENAYESLAFLLSVVEQAKPKRTGISTHSCIEDSVVIGENAFVAAHVYIADGVKIGKNVRIYANCSIEENVIIGDNVTIHAGVSIYKECVIGNDCTIHSGAVIGADGFGFAPTVDGTYNKIPQMGNVILEDCVEIGANCTIDRATLGSTIIRKGVKLDNLVQIAHNCEIGENTVIAAQTGISGSTKIGKRCIIAGQVGIAGHLQIADGTTFAAQAGQANNIKTSGQILMGSPAFAIKNFQRSSIAFKSLPDLQKMVYELNRKILELEKK